MARLPLNRHVYPTLKVPGGASLSGAIILAVQTAVLGGIALLIALAVVNTVFGVPTPQPPGTPYG